MDAVPLIDVVNGVAHATDALVLLEAVTSFGMATLILVVLWDTAVNRRPPYQP